MSDLGLDRRNTCVKFRVQNIENGVKSGNLSKGKIDPKVSGPWALLTAFDSKKLVNPILLNTSGLPLETHM